MGGGRASDRRVLQSCFTRGKGGERETVAIRGAESCDGWRWRERRAGFDASRFGNPERGGDKCRDGVSGNYSCQKQSARYREDHQALTNDVFENDPESFL